MVGVGKSATRTTMQRGAFIVLEGCDRTGKSTQSRLLRDFLHSKGIPVKLMGFPARQSNIGRVINSYLTNNSDLPDEVIHLLFTANRWEYKNEMIKLLESGVTLVVDRYSYSGVAYSVAKGMRFDWCMAAEKGLVRPDAVFYLNANVEQLVDRGNFGNERYEKVEFQHKVAKVFDEIYNEERSYWHQIEAQNQTQEQVLEEISKKTLTLLKEVQNQPLQVLK